MKGRSDELRGQAGVRDDEVDVPSTALSVSIVVPAYNEAARIERSLEAIAAYARRTTSLAFELIVVDDGSADDTAAVAERHLPHMSWMDTRVIRYAPNRGKGYAVRQGLLAARAPIALFTDADLSTPIEEMPKLVNALARGDADLAFGSRALDRSLIGVHQPWRRELGGRAFNAVLRLATGLPFWDTQCGFKAFRMSVCRPLIDAATIDGFGFDIELLYEAHRADLRLREIPVRWDHRDGSKVHFLRDGTRMLRDILTVRRRAAGGYYDRSIHLAGAAAASDPLTRLRSVPGRAMA
jgi:glycosyltransferase involved in cell wall biosynthesis